MTNPSQNLFLHRIALLLVRLSLGIYLFWAGQHKIFVAGSTLGQSINHWMEGYRESVPSFLPSFFATPYGYALPWLEMLVGLLLILGLFFRITCVVATLLFISICIALTVQAGSMAGAVHHSLVFATVTFLLFTTGPGDISVDSLLPKRRRR